MGLGGIRAPLAWDAARRAALALVAEAHAPLFGLLDDLHIGARGLGRLCGDMASRPASGGCPTHPPGGAPPEALRKASPLTGGEDEGEQV